MNSVTTTLKVTQVLNTCDRFMNTGPGYHNFNIFNNDLHVHAGQLGHSI